MDAMCSLFSCVGPTPVSDTKPKKHEESVSSEKLLELAKLILSNPSVKDLKEKCPLLQNIEPVKIVELINSVMASLDINEVEKNLKQLDPNFTSVEDYAAKTRLPPPKLTPRTSEIPNGAAEESSFILRFADNFIGTFAAAFNFFNSFEPPVTIYEMQVLLLIYFRFFEIPKALIEPLRSIMGTTWKVYAVAGIIFCVGVVAIHYYLKNQKLRMGKLDFCEDIDLITKKEYPHGFSSFPSDEMKQLLSHQNFSPNYTKKIPIFIEGLTGIGKTSLVCWLHSLIKENSPILPESFRNKKKPPKVVLINVENLMAQTKTPFGLKLKRIKDSLETLKEDFELFVFVDEAHAAKDNHDQMKQFLRMQGVNMIAMSTRRERKVKIEGVDIGSAFERIFNSIIFDEWNESRVERQLTELAYNQAEDVPLDHSAIKIAMACTKNSRDRAWFPQAEKLLTAAINAVRTNLEGNTYLPEDLDVKYDKIATLLMRKEYEKNSEELEKEIVKLEGEIKKLELDRQEKNTRIQMVRKARQLWLAFKKQRDVCHQQIQQIVNGKEIALDETLKKRYLFSLIAIRALGDTIDKDIKDLESKGNGRIRLTVNSSAVSHVFLKMQPSEMGPLLTTDENNALKTAIQKWKEMNRGSHVEYSAYLSLLQESWREIDKKYKSGFFSDFENFKDAFECHECMRRS